MNQLIKHPHDRFAKLILSDLKVAKAFLMQHLPATLKNKVNLANLQPCKGSFVDKEYREHLTDVLYKTTILDKEGYIYLLIEHQSKPDPLMAFRFLEYSVAIMKEHINAQKNNGEKQELPLVLPLLYHTGKNPYNKSNDIMDLFAQPELARQHFLQPFKLIDLNAMSDEEIRRHNVIRGFELIQKHIHARDVSYLLDCLEKWQLLLEIDQFDSELFKSVVQYILYEGEIEDTDRAIKKIMACVPDESEKIMTIAQQLENRGVQRGIQQGMQQGYIDIAKNLLAAGQPLSFIQKMTGISEEKLKLL